MALKDFEFCDAQARESLATRLGRDMSRSVTDDACWRIKADFEEMPELTVTTRQAARFWAIDERVPLDEQRGGIVEVFAGTRPCQIPSSRFLAPIFTERSPKSQHKKVTIQLDGVCGSL
jgi:hypothetical protein